MLLLTLAVVLGVLLAVGQRAIGVSVFEWGKVKGFSGILKSQPYPHYKPHPDHAGLLIRIEAKGKRTVGRFVNRQFQPVKVKAAGR